MVQKLGRRLGSPPDLKQYELVYLMTGTKAVELAVMGSEGR